MITFQRHHSGALRESHVGYCRALRAGERGFVSGTAAAHPPATTMVEIRRLVHPEMLIEIEAEAEAVA